MSTIVKAKSVVSISDEIESLFSELKHIPTELMERGRFVPMSMEDDPDISTSYNQVKELNVALERSSEDPVQAFSAANNIFNAYGSLLQNFAAAIHSVRGALGILTSRVVSRLQNIIVRFNSIVHKLVSNAIAEVKRHSKELGISSFSVSIGSTPPGIVANYIYSKSAR